MSEADEASRATSPVPASGGPAEPAMSALMLPPSDYGSAGHQREPEAVRSATPVSGGSDANDAVGTRARFA